MSDVLGTVPPAVEPDSTTPVQDAASPPGGAAPVSTPEAAQAEVAEVKQPKTVKFRDLEIELPEDLPGTVAFDWAEIEDGRKEVSPVMKMIRSIIGRDQFNALYDKVEEEGLGMEETLDGVKNLAEEIFAAYGTGLGESSASDDS